MKCLRCLKREAINKGIYCEYCIQHFDQCKKHKVYLTANEEIKLYLQLELKDKLKQIKKLREKISKL